MERNTSRQDVILGLGVLIPTLCVFFSSDLS